MDPFGQFLHISWPNEFTIVNDIMFFIYLLQKCNNLI